MYMKQRTEQYQSKIDEKPKFSYFNKIEKYLVALNEIKKERTQISKRKEINKPDKKEQL